MILKWDVEDIQQVNGIGSHFAIGKLMKGAFFHDLFSDL